MTDRLLEACRSGDVRTVKELLEIGAKVKSGDYGEGTTPLSEACCFGHLEVVRLLLEAGVTEAGGRGTLFFFTNRHRNLSFVALLLEKGFLLSREDACDILQWAKPLVPEALKTGKWKSTDEGAAVLVLACHMGNEKLAKELLCADIRRPRPLLMRALKEAVLWGHGNIVRLLLPLSGEVTPEMINKALQLAVETGKTNMVRLLMEAKPRKHGKNKQQAAKQRTVPEGALLNACENGDIKEVRWLLNAGANVNEANYFTGSTPLIESCRAGNFEIVRLLLEKGAKVDSRDESKASALMWACDKGNDQIVKLLLEAKADVNLTDKFGRAVLLWAQNPTIVKLLLVAGADPNKRNQFGRTLVSEAEKMNKWYLAEALRQAGAEE